ncbi:glycoside hydrolase [Acephala macrosclerotiorum]|nr:glycoside hydrolase [Acephala macrosclerotiorum]
MWFPQVVALALAYLTVTTLTPIELQNVESASILSVSGLKFNIDSTTGYFAGTNTYWIGFLTNDADVDLVMTHLKASGLKILRVWARLYELSHLSVTQTTSGVWFQSFVLGKTPQINTCANGLQRLDYVVSSAEAHGIKLIVNFVNNWGDYGGMPAYNTFFGTTKITWYTDAKAYIKAVVSRYVSSTAIFARELANEPRCNGCATSIVTNWATKTSAYIKSLGPNHMITLVTRGS